MRYLIPLLVLTGCSTTIHQAKGPQGQHWLEVDCSGGRVSDCLNAAAEACGGNYQPVNPGMTRLGDPAHIQLFGTSLPIKEQLLFVECQGGGTPDPDKARKLRELEAEMERAKPKAP